MNRMVFTFYRTELRSFDEIARSTFEVCNSIDGFEVEPSGEVSELEEFTPEEGLLRLYWKDGPGDVSVAFPYEPIPDSFLEISTRRTVFFPETDEGEYEGFTGAVVELARQLAIEHEPHYVVSPDLEMEMGVDPTDVIPMTTDFRLERIPWFGVYSPSLVENLGGREHVLNTPAWRVEELDTGSIMLIRTRTPYANTGRDCPVDRHLLGETR